MVQDGKQSVARGLHRYPCYTLLFACFIYYIYLCYCILYLTKGIDIIILLLYYENESQDKWFNLNNLASNNIQVTYNPVDWTGDRLQAQNVAKLRRHLLETQASLQKCKQWHKA